MFNEGSLSSRDEGLNKRSYPKTSSKVFSQHAMDFTLENAVQFIIVATGIIGQVLVIKKNIWGFVSWILSNIIMVAASYSKGYWGMACLYVFYTGMCFYGIKEWQKKTNPEETK